MENPIDTPRQYRLTINNVERDAIRISVGGQVIEAVELDMADQWDFMELAGSQIDNHAWVNTALLAASVVSIDGVPQPSAARTKDQIRQVLRKIGSRGLDALHNAFSKSDAQSVDDTTGTELTAVGN